jgi:geranylgeranyl diphosphate synthase type II
VIKRVALSDGFRHYLSFKQAKVEENLRTALRGFDGCPSSLMEAMRYSLLAPGKRIRPLLVLMANEVGGGEDTQAMPAAGAVELIHTYSLIHDDLPAMDDDDLRRGMPTCHKQFGEALAILAGDALLTLAFQLLAESYLPATAAAACKVLARAAGGAGMVGGQVEDLAWEQRRGTASDLARIHALKTGALLRAALRLGVLATQGERPDGPDRPLMDSLDGYGRCLGLVFQITDDLLDVEGTAAQAGKRVRKDAARGKLTYPSLLGAAESRRRAEELGDEARACLRPLGQRGQRLVELLGWILERQS